MDLFAVLPSSNVQPHHTFLCRSVGLATKKKLDLPLTYHVFHHNLKIAQSAAQVTSKMHQFEFREVFYWYIRSIYMQRGQ